MLETSKHIGAPSRRLFTDGLLFFQNIVEGADENKAAGHK